MALMLPLWVAAEPPEASFNNSWVEYDVMVGSQKGVCIHFDFNINHCKDVKYQAWLHIEGADHLPVHSNLSGFYNEYGQFSMTDWLKPNYEYTRFSDFKFYIPYDALASDKTPTCYWLRIAKDGSNGRTIGDSPRYSLDWSKSGVTAKAEEKPVVTFYKSWVDYDAVSNGEKGVLFHFDFAVEHSLGKEVWAVVFIKDSQNGWLKTNNTTYRANNDVICNSQKINPIYENSRWKDLTIFLPYSAMLVKEGVSYQYSLYVRKLDGTEIQNSVFYSMDLASHIPSKKTDVNCEKPTIEWLSNFSSSTPSFAVKAGIKSKTEVTQTNITVNDNSYRGMKTVKNDGYQMVLNETVTLREGSNDIMVSVTNSCGTTTKIYKVTYNKPYTEPVYAEKRVALVIGNANYQTSPLVNPVNDANDIASSLRGLGFDVKTVLNGTKRDMENAIADLRKRSDKNTVALFYYAGHGIQKNGCNYLVPVDANMQDAADVEYACTDVNRVLANMESSGCTMNIIILDACRDNPFERSWSRGLGTRGLSTLNAPRGTFIAYATSPGDVAQDGKGRNSPYAEAFLKTLKSPGLDLFGFFQEVQTQVENNTDGTQVPWISSSFKGHFYFNPTK